MVSELTAVTETGTLWIDSARLRAVTISASTSDPPVAAGAAVASAARAAEIGAIVHAAAPQSIQVSIRIVPSDVLAPAAFEPRRSGFRAHEARAWNASKAKRRLRAAQAATRRSGERHHREERVCG